MKRILYALSLLPIVGAFNYAAAQSQLPCSTDEMVNKSLREHPELQRNVEELERFTEGFTATHQPGRAVLIIPIVFHIIHNYGTENISDAQVRDAVRILNEDFRKLNRDTVDVISQFKSIVGDAEIEFRLAQLDPSGNPTNGIDRVASLETYVGDDGSKLNYWNRAKYLNVWVVDKISSGAAGYAYRPGTAPSASVDGIIILSDYIGSIGTGNPSTARALTHEIGHFLNLNHTWGGTNQPGVSCNGTDNVSDTPTTMGWTSCNLSGAICTPGVVENVQNFMDYSYCYRMFTKGQGTRMQAALASTAGQRSSLVTSANHTATGILNNPPLVAVPKADFKADFTTVCANDNVKFTDLSYNGDPTSWNWSFPGGTPSTSTDSMPTVKYTTPGTYEVTLVAANSAGSNSKTRTAYVVVNPSTAPHNSYVYSEGFEGGATPTMDWRFKGTNSRNWTVISTTAATGTYSIKLDNFGSAAGDIDEAITPGINLAAIASPKLFFKVAYAQKGTSNDDQLRVLVSLNCGKTWIARYTKSGTALKTANPTTSAFTPTATQWRKDSINLAAYASQQNVMIKFEFTGDGGNNIYLDDINISGPVSLDEVTADNNELSVYPNPLEEGSVVSFSLNDRKPVSIALYDVVGREVMKMFEGNLSSGAHNFPLENTNDLKAGVYFIRLQVEGKVFVQRLLVN